MDGHDVGMLQHARHPGFLEQFLSRPFPHLIGTNRFESDVSKEGGLPGQTNYAHPSLSDGLPDFELRVFAPGIDAGKLPQQLFATETLEGIASTDRLPRGVDVEIVVRLQ